MTKKLRNGVEVDMTAEEIAELEARAVEHDAGIKPAKVAGIKNEANIRIVAAYPEWKQRNHMAAVADIHNNELVALKAGTDYVLTADDLTVITSAKSCKAAIEAIRTKSDELEASLDSMTQAQLEAFDPTNDSNWS